MLAVVRRGWSMRVSSLLCICDLTVGTRQRCPRILPYILISLVMPLLGTAVGQVPRTPISFSYSPAELQDKHVSEHDKKKLKKYDVERIGDRAMGHGLNFYSIQRERELGQRIAAAFDRSTKLVNDPVVTDYVNRLGQKIVRNSDCEVPFTIKVFDSGEIPRAYGLPGGFLYVDSALILAADGEAELAAVMAHEIAHVAARHATRALTRRRLSDLVNSAALMTGPAGFALQNVGGVAGPLSMKKFDRDAEYEADLLAIEYAYAAGYDPEALLAALEKLHAMEVKRGGTFAKIPGYHFAMRLPFHSQIARGLSSYPLTEERIQRLQSEITTFLPDRKDYVIDTDEFQEVKARLLATDAVVLRRHGADDDAKGPVLRRNPEYRSDGGPFLSYSFLPE
jgi:beta-barrel assembly-enhancing protease